MPDELTPAQAEERLTAIYNDPKHDLHSLDAETAARGAEEVMALTRITLGAAGDVVLDTFGSASPPATTRPPGADLASSLSPFTSLHAAVTVAHEDGLNSEQFQQIASEEARYRPGQFSEEDVLHDLNPLERDRARRLHNRGFRRLPLSVQAHLESRSTHYAPKVYNRLVELGSELEELDAAIQAEAARNPGSAKLREMVRQRDGRRAGSVIVV